MAGVFASAYYLVVYPQVVHRRWYRAVDYRILCLAERRPDGVDPKQWAACLHWTWNLHGNYGGLSHFDAVAREPFLKEFDQRLKGRVDLATVDWIWDQYCVHTNGGRHYSDYYRPTTPERLKEASVDRYNELDLGLWLKWLERRRSGQE